MLATTAFLTCVLTVLPALVAQGASPSSQMATSSPINLAFGPVNGDVACVAALECTAIWSDQGGIMTANEVAGQWQSPHLLSGNQDLSGSLQVFKISCWSAGNCMVIAQSTVASSPLVVGVETNGTWGVLGAMPTGGVDLAGNALSCVAPGWCLILSSLGGPTYDVAYTVWQAGTFSSLHDTGFGFSQYPQASCWAVEQCYLFNAGTGGGGFVHASFGVSSASGWTPVQGANLDSYDFFDASCTSATFCALVGLDTETQFATPSVAWLNGTTWQVDDATSLVICQANQYGCSPGFTNVSCSGTFCLFGGAGSDAASPNSVMLEGSLLDNQLQYASPDPNFTQFMGVSCTAAWTCGQVGLNTLDYLTAITNLPTLTASAATPTNAIVGSPLSIDLNQFANGGSGTYSFVQSGGSLPNGIHLDPATGVLSGVPTSAGSYVATFSVTSPGPPTQTASLSVSIVVATPASLPVLAKTGLPFFEFAEVGILLTIFGMAGIELRRRRDLAAWRLLRGSSPPTLER